MNNFFIRRFPAAEIRTDSNYAINAIQQYAPRWRNNADQNGQWRNARGKLIWNLVDDNGNVKIQVILSSIKNSSKK